LKRRGEKKKERGALKIEKKNQFFRYNFSQYKSLEKEKSLWSISRNQERAIRSKWGKGRRGLETERQKGRYQNFVRV